MDFKTEIAKLICSIREIELEEAISLMEVPTHTEMGDYAFPCFKFAKILRKAPPQIAVDLAGEFPQAGFIKQVTPVGAYVNFFVDKQTLVKNVLAEVIEKREAYGFSTIGAGRNICVDYSSPNIAKPFHIGHLRSTAIGNALYKIYNFLGYNSVGINHLGDWGTQFGKLIVAYKNWGDAAAIEASGIEELNRIYVKFHDAADENPALNDEARLWFVKMQEGDDEALRLWKWFYDISMKEFNKIYNLLGIEFDSYAGESFYNDKLMAVVDELSQKKLLTESEGAKIVSLEDFNMPPCLIIRTDGGTLYATRDIAAALYRKKEYNFEKCIYLTAIDQNLHFAQWFKVIDLMGYDWAKDLAHVPFGLVTLEGAKLSTRKGHVVLMEELLHEAIQKTKDIIEEKNPDLENKDEIARQVGIGAVKFNDLYSNRIKDVDFSWDRMLNFDGETGPYVQYTYARACSVLRKAGIEDINFEPNCTHLTDDESVNVCKMLASFGHVVQDAANKNEPSVVTRYSVDLAQAFNKFYNANVVLVEDENVRNARAALVFAVTCVLKTALNLLGIEAPERM